MACYNTVEKSNTPCTKESCRHSIECEKYLNCSIICANYGPFTYQEIANILKLDLQKVVRIERKALKKVNNKLIDNNIIDNEGNVK